ncbi:uncharacterized protein LOC131249720 [Magnolia sinica]|uniref:uncharacterized protein LOC131249720 n=1 Tax=Magnolia sinica TaxID=86752 RepID=UPI0026588167|nr:uncharacterized protein LOC131249720 [Magnolia sinica]
MTSRDSGRARWSDLEKKIFIDCCLEEAHKGGRSGSSLTKQAWNKLIIELKKRTGKEFNQKQLKNLWDYLKVQYTAWIKLISITGHGYNALTGQFDWPEERWDEYIKANKNAAQFRNRPLSFENELRALFEGFVATGAEAYTTHSDNLLEEYFGSSSQIPSNTPMSENEINLGNLNVNINSATKECQQAPLVDLEAHQRKRHKPNRKKDIQSSVDALIHQLEKTDAEGPTIKECLMKLNSMLSIRRPDPLYFKALKSFTQKKENREVWILLEEEEDMKLWIETLD